MDISSPSAEPSVGYAMLRGPTWSLVLTDTKTVLGRSHRSNKGDKEQVSLRFKKPRAPASSRALSRRPLATSGSTLAQLSDTTDQQQSPLFWRREWSKLQNPPSVLQPHAGAETREKDDTSPQHGSNNLLASSSAQNEANKNEISISSPPMASIPTYNASNLQPVVHEEQVTQKRQCDVDLGPDPLISHFHATISYDPVLCLWDITCHSKNGLFANGRMIYPSDGPVLLLSRSRLQIGSVLFLFLLPSPSKSSESELNYITTNSLCEKLVLDEAKVDASSASSSASDQRTTSKKRKYHDRSIVPLPRISISEDDKRRKRRLFSEHVSQRPHSMRSILFGGVDGDDELKQYLSESGLAEASEESKIAHLRQTFAPRLEEFKEPEPPRYSGTTDTAYRFMPEKSRATGMMGDIGLDKKKRAGRTPKSQEGVDSSGIVHERPKLTYNQLIFNALSSSPDKRMLFPDITDFIARTWPFYTTEAAGSWQNSLRQGLTNTPDFVRHNRGRGQGKGGYWALSAWYDGDRLLPHPKQ